MSLHILALGALIADPIRRTGKNGDYATALLRTATDNDSVLISLIAFNDAAETLLAYRHGSTLAVSGRAKLTSWTGRDSEEHHGLSLVIEQVASASAARRADGERRREKRNAA
jgi:single-stranded DNA-binding protein